MKGGFLKGILFTIGLGGLAYGGKKYMDSRETPLDKDVPPTLPPGKPSKPNPKPANEEKPNPVQVIIEKAESWVDDIGDDVDNIRV